MSTNGTGPTLAELVTASGKNYEEIDRASGHGISAQLVSKIVNKGHLPEYPDKIKALAKGLGVSVKKVEDAIARSPRRHPYRTDLVEYEELTDQNRAAVRAFAVALLEQQRRTEDLAHRIERAEQAADFVEEVTQEAVETGQVNEVAHALADGAINLLQRTRRTTSDTRSTDQ